MDDYAHEGVIGFIDLPEWKQLEAIVDPLTYVDRYTMPKFVITATGDEFFPPDSPQFWWDKLPVNASIVVVFCRFTRV